MEPPSWLPAILAALGERPRRVRFLATGATARVWRVVAERRAYAFRLIHAPQRALDCALDADLRAEARRRGAAVAEPVLNWRQRQVTPADAPWALDELVAGRHPARGRIAAPASRALGETLAILHGLEVAGHGPLTSVAEGVFTGGAPDPLAGVGRRFDKPTPALWPTDHRHPVLLAAPELAAKATPHLEAVEAAIQDSAPVLCHSDLHERQMIQRGPRLAALIDFGDAAILDRRWDLGSALYFHGPEVYGRVRDAYMGACAAGPSEIALAPSFAIAVAFHHASRSRLPGKRHRLARAISYLRDALA